MVRLPDVVNQVRRRANEVTTLIRYPVQMATQALRRTGQHIYENIQLPRRQGSSPVAPPPAQESSASPAFAQPTLSTGTSTLVRPVYEPDAPDAMERQTEPERHSRTQIAHRNLRGGLPLPSGTVLKSRWNSYTVGDCFQETDRTRLYQGINRSGELMLIKEYRLFERDFSLEEIQDRQHAFERLIELNLKISNGPDFRIIKLVDAITLPKEHCCYLITKPITPHRTLADYLADHPAQKIPPKEIRIILKQVLQTLQFLHEAYRVHFPNGDAERGLPHGNLSLHSLVIRPLALNVPYDQQFFVYLTDLALWEHLFYPSSSQRFRVTVAKTTQELGSVKQDLMDLGLIGFQLAGGTPVPPRQISTALETDPGWRDLDDIPLKREIERLLGLHVPFSIAEEALQSFSQLPPPDFSSGSGLTLISEDIALSPPRRTPWLVPVAILLSLGVSSLVGWLFWRAITQVRSPVPLLVERSKPLSRFQPVNPVSLPIIYAVEEDGALDYALDRTFFTSSASGSLTRQTHQQTLVDVLRERGGITLNPPSQTTITPSPQVVGLSQASIPSSWAERRPTRMAREVLWRHIVDGKVDVGFARLPGSQFPQELPEGLTTATIAYDALVVLVPFVDPYTAKDTVGELQGAISLEELRQLYTQSEVEPIFRGRRVKLFFSEIEETNQLFKALVLNNDPVLMQQFDQLRQQVKEDGTVSPSNRPRPNLYEKMLVHFETTDGASIGIGFDRLSRAFGQCSVYPLAIQQGTHIYPPLIQADGQPIGPETDLCGAKGSYFPSIQDYSPQLIYELGLVYKADSPVGKPLAALLSTDEGHYLMNEVGLFPMRSVPDLLSAIWDTTDAESR